MWGIKNIFGGPRTGAQANNNSNATIPRVAARIISRIDNSTKMGGLQNFEVTNRFTYYQQLGKATPHASTGLLKLGLTLTKGMEFDSKSKADIEDFKLWARKTNYIEQAQTKARLLCRDGIFCGMPIGKAGDTFRINPLLMSSTTLLPADITGTKDDLLQPEVTKVMVNEGLQGREATYKPTNLIITTLNAWDYVQEDILGRQTIGMYGASLMDPIELSIRNLLNMNQGYVSFVRKYGMGRYLFDFKILNSLVEKGVITYDEAQKSIDKFNEKHKSLGENEDISSLGLDVIPIDAKGSIEVDNFKKSLETDIQIGLLQSPLTMGRSEGSTYGAGYVAEEDRLLALEGLQKVVENGINEDINRRLEVMGKASDSVTVHFEELSRIKLEASDVQGMYDTGVINQDMFRNWAGFKNTESLNTGSEA